VARLSIADSGRYLRVAEQLDSDRRALEALRLDLLTGGASREDVVGPPGWRTANPLAPVLDPIQMGGHDPSPYLNEGPSGHPDRDTDLDPYHPNPTAFSPGMMEEIGAPGYDPEAAFNSRTQQTQNAITQRYPDLAGGGAGMDPEDIENQQFLHPVGSPGWAEKVDRGQALNNRMNIQKGRADEAQGAWQKSHQPKPKTPAPKPGEQLSLFSRLEGSDRRWVTLEAAKFVAANPDALDDSHEMAVRAANYAAVKTSTFPMQRSAAITEAFVATVGELGRQSYKPPTVRTAAVDVSFDPQAMYL